MKGLKGNFIPESEDVAVCRETRTRGGEMTFSSSGSMIARLLAAIGLSLAITTATDAQTSTQDTAGHS